LRTLAGQPVDDHRHRVAQRKFDEQLVAALLRAGIGEQPRLERGSVSSSGTGPLAPAAWKRLIIVRIVEGAAPSDARPRGSVRHQRTSTAALRALGAWWFSLLASGPSFGRAKPIFYSWRGSTWHKSLILLGAESRLRESVVPRHWVI
jgi:hypothetical protein